MHMDNVILFQFPAGKEIPNYSPFCMKLETYFRIAQIPYHVQDIMDTRKGPKQKIPFAKINGKDIGDSGIIIDYFEHTLENPLDHDLNAEQLAQALALRRLLEEHLYFTIMWARWIDETGWEHVKRLFFSRAPKMMRLLSGFIRKQTGKQLYQQGIGRHSREEIYKMGMEDIDAMATLLGERSYFFGKKITSIDACLFAFIGSIWFVPWSYPLKTHLLTKNNLLDYYGRIAREYFHEFPDKPST